MDRLCGIKAEEHTAVALGIFDGVHTGHRAVLRETSLLAEKSGLVPAVCSFSGASVSTKGSDYRPVYSDSVKEALLRREGARYVCLLDFGRVRDMSPEDFAEKILFGAMNARAAVCGEDFRFGKNASCGAEGLGKICEKLGMEICVVPEALCGGVKISSADIRRKLSEGDIKGVNLLMGSDYFVRGEIIRGKQLASQLGFPTANQRFAGGTVVPKFGVYASYAEIDGVIYKGITNIGVKPTVDYSGEPLAETYFSGYSGSLYGRVTDVCLTGFIRPEQKFSGVDKLRERIKKDIEIALAINEE